MSMNCQRGDLAMAVRNTSSAAHADSYIGNMIDCDESVQNIFGQPAWLLDRPLTCAICGGTVFGYLDADLQPLRGPQRGELEAAPLELQPEVAE